MTDVVVAGTDPPPSALTPVEFHMMYKSILDGCRKEYLTFIKMLNKDLHDLYVFLSEMAEIPNPNTDNYSSPDIQEVHRNYLDAIYMQNLRNYYSGIANFINRDLTFIMLGNLISSCDPDLFHRLVIVESWMANMEREDQCFQLIKIKLDEILA
ncbi:MAG: hypothetical protein EBU33_07495 [Sphingobacteriia bacterium]|nr:hypothetical protein [Sphingobacteriia bacterium]